jgi:transcriptional regulator of acetoin/glycerol metabolism
MSALVEHNWPGNVRKLQNFIERAVLLSPGLVFRAPLDSLDRSGVFVSSQFKTLAPTEFDHILRAVRYTDRKIGGPVSAATRLGLKRTTLIGKMRKLGLSWSGEASSYLPSRSLP